MKFIPKLQQGGGFVAFTPYIPSSPTPQMPTTSKKDDSDNSGSSILDDALYKEMIKKDVGLTNEVNQFTSELAKLEGSETNPYLQPKNRLSSIKLIGTLNALRENKDAWTQSVNEASKQGTLSEVAVGSRGELFVKDKVGTVKGVTLADYQKNKNTQQLLTVQDLLNERRLNPNLVGRNDIFNVANDAVSLKTIKDDVLKLVKDFGTDTEISDKVYSKAQWNEIQHQMNASRINIKGPTPTKEEFEQLQKLNSLTDVNSDYVSVEQNNSSQRGRVEKGLKYIWEAMGEKAQNKLSVIAALSGDTPGSMLMNMISNSANDSHSEKVKPVKIGDGSSGQSDKPMNNFQMSHNDKLMSKNLTFAFNDAKLGVLLKGAIGGVFPLMTPNDETIPMTSVQNIANIGYNQFLDFDNASFGNKSLESYDFKNVVYDGKDAAKVYMPVDDNGRPDYNAFKIFKEIYATYESNKDKWSTSEATRFFKDHNFDIKIGEETKNGINTKVIMDNSHIKPFLVFYGYTNDGTALGKDNPWVTKLTSDEEKAIMPDLDKTWSEKIGTKIKSTKPNEGWFGNYYKGMIAIPYRPASNVIVDSFNGRGPTVKATKNSDVQYNLNTTPAVQSVNGNAQVLN